MMKNRLKKIVSILACITILFGVLTNNIVATENNQIQQNELIKEIILLKNNNTEFSKNEELKFGDTFKMRYYFKELSVVNTEGTIQIEVDKKYDLGNIPEFLTTNSSTDTTWGVYLSGMNILLGKATCTSDGNLSIIFENSEDINDAERITDAYLEFSVELDKAQCGNQEEIKISLGGSSDDYTVIITDNKPLAPVLTKKGAYTEATKTFHWTITIKKGGIFYNDGLKLIDTISENQRYVAGSFKISKEGSTAQEVEPVINANDISYETIDGKCDYVITYQTRLRNSAYVVNDKVANNQEVTVKNTAQLFNISNGKTVTGDDCTIVQKTGVNWIEKTSDEKTVNTANNEAIITWYIEVDTNGLAFSNVILYDTITSGVPNNSESKLSLVTNSITCKNNPIGWNNIVADNDTGNIDKNNYNWSINLNEALNVPTLNGKYMISYQTKITNYSEYIKHNQPQVKNDARITFECLDFGGVNPSNSYGTPTVSKGSTITAGMIEKEYVEYNKTNHQIAWKVTFNKNKNEIIDKVEIQDTIAADNEHRIVAINNLEIDGTAIDNPDIYYKLTTSTDKKYMLEFKDVNLISKKEVSFNVITQLTNPNYYENNNQEEIFKNTATVFLDDKEYSTVNATTKPKITVLSKEGISYDYKDQTVAWKIITNQDKMKLEGAKIEDALIPGLSLVESSIVLKDSQGITIPVSNAVSTTKPYYIYQNGILTVYLHTINDTYTLTYQTKLDLVNGIFDGKSFTNYNGDIAIKNTATLLKDTSNSTNVDTAFEVTNKALEKQGTAIKDDQMIKYHIGINQALTPMKETMFEDILSPGLQLSLPSIALYEATVDKDGKLSKDGLAMEIVYTTTILDKENDKQKPEGSTLLQVHIPKNNGKAYILEYNAYVTDFTHSDFINEIQGEGIIPGNTETSASFSANNVGVGGAGALVKSSIAEFTLEDKDTEVGIQGVEYTLYYQDKEIGKQVTDSSGKITFKGLEEGVSYRLVQTGVVPGYVDTPVEITFTGPKKGSSNKLETTLDATKLPLVIKNIDDENKVMVDSILSMYKLTNNPMEDIKEESIKDLLTDDNLIVEMITNNDGKVSYIDPLVDGVYVITQTKVTMDYQISTDYILVLVKNNLIINMYNSKDTNKLFSNTITNIKKEIQTPDIPNVPGDPNSKPQSPEVVNATKKPSTTVDTSDHTTISMTVYMMFLALLGMIIVKKREEK